MDIPSFIEAESEHLIKVESRLETQHFELAFYA